MNQSKTWLASDLHFGHKELVEQGLRKKDYEERFLIAWNDLVGKDDVVILLGNIAVNPVAPGQKPKGPGAAYWFSRIKDMPGKKVLMCGQWDRNRENWYKKQGIDEVHPFGQYLLVKYYLGQNGRGRTYLGNVMLTHVPASLSVGTAVGPKHQAMMQKFERQFHYTSSILNIHGYTCGKGLEKHNTFDVGMDVVGEQLVTLDQIVELKLKVGKIA